MIICRKCRKTSDRANVGQTVQFCEECVAERQSLLVALAETNNKLHPAWVAGLVNDHLLQMLIRDEQRAGKPTESMIYLRWIMKNKPVEVAAYREFWGTMQTLPDLSEISK